MKQSLLILSLFVIMTSIAFGIPNTETLLIRQTFTQNTTIPIQVQAPIFSIKITGKIAFHAQDSFVRILLSNQQNKRFVVYETYPLLQVMNPFTFHYECNETCTLDETTTPKLEIDVYKATFTLNAIHIDYIKPRVIVPRDLKEEQKVAILNQNLDEQGYLWRAGVTAFSQLPYEIKAASFIDGTMPVLNGFEYYQGGIFSIVHPDKTRPTSRSVYPENLDYRNYQGKDWMTDVVLQFGNSCFFHSLTALVEAFTKFYYNIPDYDLDLSEWNLVSCLFVRDEISGLPEYIIEHGIVDEDCHPYEGIDFEDPPEENLATQATATTSYITPGESLDALNDELEPLSSSSRWHVVYSNSPETGTQWVQYDWAEQKNITRINVYWFDDDGAIDLPIAARLFYWDGNDFEEVVSQGEIGVLENRYNSFTFTEITTDKLRLEFDSNGSYSTGILEWEIYETVYTFYDMLCSERCVTPSEHIEIFDLYTYQTIPPYNITSIKDDQVVGQYSWTETNVKEMLWDHGPFASGVCEWDHAMLLIGYGTIQQGEILEGAPAGGQITIYPDSPYIGETYWIMKNSWGTGHGNNGFGKILIPNIETSLCYDFTVDTPITSSSGLTRQCYDNDGDGFYYWGIGDSIPDSCPNNVYSEPDCDDTDAL